MRMSAINRFTVIVTADEGSGDTSWIRRLA